MSDIIPIDPARQARDLATMRDSSKWPLKTRLPLKRKLVDDCSFPELGYLQKNAGSLVFVANVFDHTLPPQTDWHMYDSYEAIVEAGWVVD